MSFFKDLEQSINKKDSLLCIGIDPQGDSLKGENIYERLLEFGNKIIKETNSFAACFKPNIAFYESFGIEGLRALKKTIELVPEDTPVILDAKRSDIGNTAKAYSEAVFNYYKADAVTLNPYLGKESFLPFLDYKEKGIFALCRTSNPCSGKIQELKVLGAHGFSDYYIELAREILTWGPNIGLVVAGNDPEALKKVREVLPDVWFLAPGIGAQGGTIKEALECGLSKDGKGILLNVSRGISMAASPKKAAKDFQDQINKERDIILKENRGKSSFVIRDDPYKDNPKKQLINDLIESGCFKLGEFELKSGITSPFYIDLRMIISYPSILYRVGLAYISIIEKLECTKIAGIPFAGIPIASSISLLKDIPMIFPRLVMKKHGTGNKVEGKFNSDDKIVLVDDLITTGKSKFEAIDVLKSEGIGIKDLVVLVERGTSGREELNSIGVKLHSYIKIEEFLEVCLETGRLTQDKYSEIEKFLKE